MQRRTFVASGAAALATAVFAPPVRGTPVADAPSIPTPSFASAVAGIEATIAADRADPLIAATGMPRLYHHGGPVDHAVVLFHGFTNCPQQFDVFARDLHARGCNVYVPRIPYHGFRDRDTRALDALSNDLLATFATTAAHLTMGLGAKVSAAGLSLGGTLAMYLAQTQPIDHVVPIAPFLMPIGVPGWLGMPAMTLVSWIPDIYVWWDPRIKDACTPLYAYPGFPSHALASCVFFGNTVVHATAPARARRCTLVTNASESAVNNGYAAAVIDRWNTRGGSFDRVVLDDLGPPRHDIIDPTTFPAARVLVYPTIASLILG